VFNWARTGSFTQSLSAADLGNGLRKEDGHRLCLVFYGFKVDICSECEKLVYFHWRKTEKLSEQNSNDYKRHFKKEGAGEKEYWTNWRAWEKCMT
jgi:hypothetical protein